MVRKSVVSPVGNEKVYGENDLPKSQVLSSEWKTERVREDASGDNIHLQLLRVNYSPLRFMARFCVFMPVPAISC